MKRTRVRLLCLLLVVAVVGVACAPSDAASDAVQADSTSDVSDVTTMVEQSDEAMAFCESLAPPTSASDEMPSIHLINLELNPEKAEIDGNQYVANLVAVKGAADISFPMAVCPLSSTDFPFSFRGVRCELWIGGIATFEKEEIVLAHDYAPCEFSDVPPGEHDLKIALCCSNDCSNGLETCNFGHAWVEITVE